MVSRVTADFFAALKHFSEISCLRGFVAALYEAQAAEPRDDYADAARFLLVMPTLAHRDGSRSIASGWSRRKVYIKQSLFRTAIFFLQPWCFSTARVAHPVHNNRGCTGGRGRERGDCKNSFKWHYGLCGGEYVCEPFSLFNP